MTPADPLAPLRRRRSVKWSAFPDDVLPLWVAEMDFPLAPAITAALRAALDHGDTGYAHPQDGGAARAFAGFARDTWGWSPEVDRMAPTTDVTVVIVESLRRLVAPGEGVIITPPVYPPFFDLVPEAGGRVVEVPLLGAADAAASPALDLAGIDRALAAGARGVLLCHPHNPLGLVHPREHLEELARIVDRHGGFVISDEIHAPLTHHGVTFTPYLAVSDAARDHGLTAGSGSKAFNLAGLKAAFFVAAGERMTALIRSLPDEVTYRTGHFGLLATEAGFTDGRDWLAATITRIEDNVALLDRLVADRLPGVVTSRPRAGYLSWLDLRALGWGDDPAAVALERARVALTPGPGFGRQGAGFARMNLGCAPDLIEAAVDRLAAAR